MGEFGRDNKKDTFAVIKSRDAKSLGASACDEITNLNIMKTKLFCLLSFVLMVTGFVCCTPAEEQHMPFTVTYGAASEFSKNYAIPELSPTLTNGTATSFSITPALSAGLTLNTTTGVISGTPTAIAATTSYIVTASGPDGSASSHIVITVSDVGPLLIVKFKFDPNQVRLNNFGNPSSVAAGNAAQSPVFNTISSHYLELAQTDYTALGAGAILYTGPSTSAGGAGAIDFNQAHIVAEGVTFLTIPLHDIAAGSYKWVRCSLSYQNFNIAVRSSGVDYTGSLASFVGFRTYIGNYTIGGHNFVIDANRDQGYWGFAMSSPDYSTSGQSAGVTTVPNPLSSTSPIPAGSCVVTGKFASNMVVTGSETHNVVMTLSLSINKSFEWHEVTFDGKYEPSIGEYVVDMGLRGLIPSFQ